MSKAWRARGSLQTTERAIQRLLHGRRALSTWTPLPHHQVGSRTLEPLISHHLKSSSCRWAAYWVLSRSLTTRTDVEDELTEFSGSDSAEDLANSDADNSDFEDLNVCSKESHGKSAKESEESEDINVDEGGENALVDHSDDDYDEDEKVLEVGNDNDTFQVGSLLDLETSTTSKDLGDVERPLWMRMEQAAGEKSGTLKGVLKTWVDEGNPLSRNVVINSITVLRRRRKYARALELSDWVMTEKPYDLGEMDYAIRVELIGKVFGVRKGTEYFGTIPRQHQTAMAYSILLTIYVARNMEKEAVKLVEKVEKLGMDHLTYMYNQLLFLYKRNGYMKGVADVLQAMDDKEIDPDVYTYNIILDVRARKGDVEGMEKVWAQMQKDKSVKPDAPTYAILAKGYSLKGMADKAMEASKMAEVSPFRRKRTVRCIALRLYGELGKETEVERVWNSIVSSGLNIHMGEYLTMIQAIGKAAGAERAEEIFKEMEKKLGISSVQQYNALFLVYATRGMIQKGEKLMKKIAKSSLHPNPATYNHLVHMYLKAGEEVKAIEALKRAQTAAKTSFRDRPMYSSFQSVLETLAEKGDVRNAEKVFKEIKDAGYACTYRTYSALLEAYKKAEMSPFGFLDRLKADNVFPNPQVRSLLKQLDGT